MTEADRIEQLEQERRDMLAAVIAIVQVAGGEVRVGPETLLTLRDLELVRYDDPSNFGVVFRVRPRPREVAA